MAVIGTFGSYTAARLAIYSSQAAMNVTGNNIGNINTKGYTRQRTDQCSMYSVGAPRYQNSYNINIGYGAIVDSVSQLRDPFLDIRFRNENASLGYHESMQEGLNQISHILDEVGRGDHDFGIIEAQLGDFKTALSDLLESPGFTSYDDLVRSSASTLCSLLNSAAKELKQVKSNEEARLLEDVKDVNRILDNIRDLNEQIRTQAIYGGNALELRDARNVQIDNLSKYMKINVTYSMEKINEATEIEKLTISLADVKNADSGEDVVLVDGVFATQLELPEKVPMMNPDYDPLNGVTDKYLKEVVPAPANPTSWKDLYVPTDVEADAFMITNYDEDDNTNNQYMFKLDALKDKNGDVMNKGKIDILGNSLASKPVQLGDNDMYGSLQALRELLTEEGEFSSYGDILGDPNAATKRGIPYYQHMLDNFAQKFAQEMNAANQMDPTIVYEMNGTDFLKVDATGAVVPGQYVQVEAGNPPTQTVLTQQMLTPQNNPPTDAEIQQIQKYLGALRQQGKLKDAYDFYDGGVLFSNNGNLDDPTGITAENISVAHSWSEGAVRILNTTQANPKHIENGQEEYLDGKTRNDRIAYIISMIDDKEKTFNAADTVEDAVDTGKPFFTGSYQEMFGKATSTLGADSQTTNALYSNFNITTLSLDNDRISVSGVDLNEEATNMMQYSQSFSAACKLLTTIDEMLDRLINNTI